MTSKRAAALLLACTLVVGPLVTSGCSGGSSVDQTDDADVSPSDGAGDDVRPDDAAPPSDGVDDLGRDDTGPGDDIVGVPTLACFIVVRDGERALDGPVDLALGDEPAEYADVPGFQVDVRAEGTDIPAEARAVLRIDGQTVGDEPVVPDEAGGVAATLAGITLPHAPSGLPASVELTVGGALVATCVATLRVDLGMCPVSLTPMADQCLLNDEDMAPGFQRRFVVSSQGGGCDRAALVYQVEGTSLMLPAVALDDAGEAEFVLTLFPTAAALNNEAVLVTGIASDSANPSRESQTTPQVYTVDTEAPAVTLTVPVDETVTIDEDSDGNPGNGIQLVVSGRARGLVPADGVALTLRVDGRAERTAGVASDGAFAFAAYTFTEAGTHQLEVLGVDTCGQQSSIETTIAVFPVMPDLAVLTPADGTALWARDDGESTTPLTYETTFDVQAFGVQPGTTLTVRCRRDSPDSPRLDVGSLVVDEPSEDGRYAIPVALRVDLQGPDQSCSVSTDGPTAVTSAPVALWVALPAPRLTLLTPAEDALLATDAIVVTGTAANLSGRPLELHLDDEAGVPVVVTVSPTPILGGTFSGTISLELAGQPVPDGRYRAWVDATDTLGNVASEQAASDVDAWVRLDRTAAALAFDWPPTGGLNPSVDPQAADSDPGRPGYQSDVRVRVSGEADTAGVEVCLTRDGVAVGCVTLGADEDVAVFEDVTFQPGANTLIASATDAAGNEGVAAPYPVELVFDAPRVVFDEPPAGLVTASPTVTAVVRVTSDAGAVDGAEVSLLVNDVPLGVAPEALGGGRYRFEAVPLAEGANVLEALASAGGTEGSTGPHPVTYKVDGPVVTFATPTDGAVLNLVSSACTVGEPDCTLDVVLDTANLEDGSSGTLTVDCGTGPQVFESHAESDALSFAAVVLPDGATCTLAVAVTDVVGQSAEVGPITVRVDRTAPLIDSIDLPDVLQAAGDEQPETDGMQITLTVLISGVEAGQTLAVHIENSLGEASDHATVLTTDIPDGAVTPISLGVVTLPEGFVEVTADVADAAANPAETARRSVYVNSEEPDVRLLLPLRVANDACTTSADCSGSGVCGASGCGIPWSAASTFEVQVGLQGIAQAEGTLRVCSDHAALSDRPACAGNGGGYHEVVRADVTGDVSNVSLETLLPEGFQVLIAEAEALPGSGEWISSVDNPVALYQERHVYVDTEAPTVETLTSPSDTEEPVDVLNAAEQVAPGRVYRLRVTASEDGTATFRLNGADDGSAPIVGGVAELDVTLVEGANAIQARVRDLVGNVSSLSPAPAWAPFVDTAPPTLVFEAPDHSPILVGDSRDVALRSSAIGRDVTLFDGDPAVELATATVEPDGVARFPHAVVGALSDGSHRLSGRVTDSAGNPAVAATSPPVIEVDTVPPTLVVAAPEDGRVFADADDADAGMGGFQVTVRFTPSGAATWSLDLASGCDVAFENCDAPVAKGSGDATAGTEVSRVITVPVAGATSHHIVSVETRDALGNTARERVGFSLQLTACVVSLSGLPPSGIYNNALCTDTPGRDCEQVDATLSVSTTMTCTGVDTIALSKDGVEFTRTSDLDVGGGATFDVPFAHAESFQLSAQAIAGAAVVGDSGGQPVLVDLHDPVPQFVATVVDGFATPASGARPLYGIADDQQPASPGTAEIHVQLTATDDVGLVGGRVASFYRTTDGASVAVAPSNVSLPLAIQTEPWSVDLKNLALPHGGPHTMRITVADGAGNTATTAIVPSVDLLPPSPVALDPIADADVNARRPSILLGWTAVGDDGDGGDAAAGYDIRFSNQPITNDDQFAAACPADELVGGLPLPTPAAPGALETFTFDGPDARSPIDPCRFVTSLEPQTYYVAARAIDDAGNVSALGAASVQSTAAVQLRAAAITHQGVALDEANEGDIDYWVWSVGDLDGDGTEDMAFGGFWASTVCVLYGHTDDAAGTFGDYLMDGLTGPEHACIQDGSLTYFGFTTSRPIDVNGDGIHDLVLGSGSRFPGWPANETVRVYLGRDGAPISGTPNVTITGMQTFQFTGLVVDSAGNFNGDLAGGRPVDDIVVSSDLEGPAGAETGAVYVIPGRASWTAATSLSIDVSDPGDRAANDVARIALQGAVPVFDGGTYVPPLFGYRVAGAGNVLTDAGATQYDDILIAQRIHKRAVYLVKGRPLTGGAEIFITDSATVPTPPTGEDAQIVRLQPEFTVTASNFGDTLIGGVDLDGRGVPDVIVTHPINAPGNNFHVFWGEAIQGRQGQLVTRISLASPPETVGDGVLRGTRGVIFPGNHQRPALLGDFDDAGGTVDLVYGIKGVSDFGEVMVRLNLGLPALDGALGVFPFEDLLLQDPTGGGSLCFGSSLAGPGDVNGDGLPDLLVGGGGCGTAWLIY